MSGNRAVLAVFALAWASFALATHARVFAAGNDASRWAQVEALVDLHSRSIEGSRFAATIDKVRIAGREYSNKPPLLALAAAAVYAPLEAVTGWRLGGPPAGAGEAIRWTTIAVVGTPSAALVALFFAVARRLWGAGPAVGLATFALGWASLLTSYSGTFNNHTVAAALVFAGLAAAIGGRAGASALALGLAAGVDILPGAGFVPVAAWILRRAGRRAALRFAGGLALTAAIAIAADLAVVGSPWPPKLVPGAVDLSASVGRSAGGVVLPQSRTYALELLVGGHGLLTVSPVLVFGLWGGWRCARDRRAEAPLARSTTLAIGAGVLLQFAGHALLAGSYGGWSYGYRYLIPIQPLLLLFAPPVLAGAGRFLFVAALAPSALFAWLGAYHPWPPAYEQESQLQPVAALVRQPIGGNAAAWLAVHRPESALARSTARVFVSPDPALQRQYFALFFGSKGDLATMRRFAPGPPP
jgi:hypothetical protein